MKTMSAAVCLLGTLLVSTAVAAQHRVFTSTAVAAQHRVDTARVRRQNDPSPSKEVQRSRVAAGTVRRGLASRLWNRLKQLPGLPYLVRAENPAAAEAARTFVSGQLRRHRRSSEGVVKVRLGPEYVNAVGLRYHRFSATAYTPDGRRIHHVGHVTASGRAEKGVGPVVRWHRGL